MSRKYKIITFIVIFLILSTSIYLILNFNDRNSPDFEAKAEVLWVSDGDTIGVKILKVDNSFDHIETGKDVVRFAGIDTEEIHREDAISEHPDVKYLTQKEYESSEYYAHAVDAKELVKSLAGRGSIVYLDLDEGVKGGNCRGHFGRLIAVVYSKIDNRIINVNARVLNQEYPTSYDPDYGLITDYPSEFEPRKWLSEDYAYI